MTGLQIHLSIYDDEKQLLIGLQRGDNDACTCFVKQFAPLVYTQAMRMVNDPDEAESILQTTFIKACAKIGEFEGRSGLSTWLYRIATNEALMFLRRQQTPRVSIEKVDETVQPGDMPHNLNAWPIDPAHQVLDGEIRAQLELALVELPENLRLVFILREIQELSTEETATTLGLSISAVKVRLHRARLRLRELLADYFNSEGDAQ